ncbi:hypothetical protein ACWD1Y_20355 [Streptomyces sp. NPDC002814]
MAALLSATVVPAASAAPDGSGHGVPLDQLTVVTTPVASGLKQPVAMVAANDHSGRMLIAERARASTA